MPTVTDVYVEYFEGDTIPEIRDAINACIGHCIRPNDDDYAANDVKTIAITQNPSSYVALVVFEMVYIGKELREIREDI